jgi:hypothetical protein
MRPDDPEHSDDFGTEPIDLETLILHVTNLSDNLAEAWSDALDEARLTEAYAQLEAEWGSLVAAVLGIQRAVANRLEGAGIDPRIPELPPFSGQIAQLQHAPDDEQYMRQSQMAQLMAFELLAQAVGPLLGSRGDAETTLTGGMAAPRWQSDAFTAARERALLLARLVRAGADAEQRLLGTSPGVPRIATAGIERLGLARSAWSRGDPEAALTHAHLATRLLIADVLGVTTDALPTDLPQRLSSQSALGDLSGMLQLTERLVIVLSGGAEPDLSVCALLVPTLLETLQAVATDPPLAALRAALPPEEEG